MYVQHITRKVGIKLKSAVGFNTIKVKSNKCTSSYNCIEHLCID